LFNLAIDSKLRGCDLCKFHILNIATGRFISNRAIIMQQKSYQPVKFEINAAPTFIKGTDLIRTQLSIMS
jgi:hypothetical protein